MVSLLPPLFEESLKSIKQAIIKTPRHICNACIRNARPQRGFVYNIRSQMYNLLSQLVRKTMLSMVKLSTISLHIYNTGLNSVGIMSAQWQNFN